MGKALLFNDVVEAAESLSLEEQEALVDLLRRRLAERGRQRVAEDIRQANKEFEEGLCQPATPDEIIDEILS
jgi:hypothetical protein